MKITNVLTILAGLLTAFSLYNIENKGSFTEAPTDLVKFVKWMKENNKSYKSPKEFIYRFQVFQETIKRIEKTQNSAKLYTVGLNKFSDMTKEEFLTKYTGLKFTDTPRKVQYIESSSNEAEVDWRGKGAVNSVQDQGRCGSCWAFSAIASVEAAYAIAGNPLKKFSEQQLVDCSGPEGNHGCEGGWMDWAFEYLEKRQPELASDYPYIAKNDHCRYNKDKTVKAITGYVDVPHGNIQQLLNAARKTVVSVAIDADDIMDYQGGIYNGPCHTQLNHGVAVIGFGTDNGVDYWIVRNSWSANWGEHGYIRMERVGGGAGKCGILMRPSYSLFQE